MKEASSSDRVTSMMLPAVSSPMDPWISGAGEQSPREASVLLRLHELPPLAHYCLALLPCFRRKLERNVEENVLKKDVKTVGELSTRDLWLPEGGSVSFKGRTEALFYFTARGQNT